MNKLSLGISDGNKSASSACAEQRTGHKQHQGIVLSIVTIAPEVFKVTVQIEKMPTITPGQFLNVRVPGGKFLLRRPLGICDFDIEKKTIVFCFQIKGEGTRALSKIENGDVLDILLPLGNGFPVSYKRIMLVGGGIGVFPLMTVAKGFNEVYSFLGFRTKDAALFVDDFKKNSIEMHLASDDGTVGEKGYITTVARREFERIKPEAVFACGPPAMFRALKKVFDGVGVPVYVSLEERMACGFGACLCCNVKIKKGEEVSAQRVCCEGPVFKIEEVVEL